jgi:hypothetical protein
MCYIHARLWSALIVSVQILDRFNHVHALQDLPEQNVLSIFFLNKYLIS